MPIFYCTLNPILFKLDQLFRGPRTSQRRNGRNQTLIFASSPPNSFSLPSVETRNWHNWVSSKAFEVAMFFPGGKNGTECTSQVASSYFPRTGLLFAEMDKFCRRSGTESSYHPTIFSGDMNALPYSYLYKFIQGKRLKYSGLQVGIHRWFGCHFGALSSSQSADLCHSDGRFVWLSSESRSWISEIE